MAPRRSDRSCRQALDRTGGMRRREQGCRRGWAPDRPEPAREPSAVAADPSRAPPLRQSLRLHPERTHAERDFLGLRADAAGERARKAVGRSWSLRLHRIKLHGPREDGENYTPEHRANTII